MIHVLNWILVFVIFLTKKINVLRFYLNRYSFGVHLFILIIFIVSIFYFKSTSTGPYLLGVFKEDSRFVYLVAGGLFLASSITFRIFYNVFRPTIRYIQYLIVHNLGSLREAQSAFKTFVWTPLENRVLSKSFLIFFLLVCTWFSKEFKSEIVCNLLVTFSLLIISMEIVKLIIFTFFPNHSMFSFLSKKSSLLEKDLILELLIFEKQNGFDYEKSKHQLWRKYNFPLSWFQKLLLFFESHPQHGARKREFSNILYEFIRIKSSHVFDIDFVKGNYFYRSFFLFFLTRVILFFIWLTSVMCLLINFLTIQKYLTFKCEMKNIGDVLYFWITSMSTVGYGDCTIVRSNVASYLLATLIVTLPLVLITLLFFVYSTLSSTNLEDYRKEATRSIQSIHNRLYERITHFQEESFLSASNEEKEHINDMTKHMKKKSSLDDDETVK